MNVQYVLWIGTKWFHKWFNYQNISQIILQVDQLNEFVLISLQTQIMLHHFNRFWDIACNMGKIYNFYPILDWV